MKLYDHIPEDIQEWTMKQSVFFAASSPLHGKHVNISPKGLPASSFSILNPNLCAYVDATGSGIETIANILENQRVTLMFCSFATSPRILRIFCTGKVVEWNEPEFERWLSRMNIKEFPAARAVIVLNVFKVQTSCGFGVPLLALKADSEDPTKQIPYLQDRKTLGHYSDKLVASNTVGKYQADNNFRSMDGLPGLKAARRYNGETIWYGDLKARMQRPSGTVHTLIVAIASVLTTILAMCMLGMVNPPPLLFIQ